MVVAVEQQETVGNDVSVGDAAKLRDPAWREPGDLEIAELLDQMRSVANALARRMSARSRECMDNDHTAPAGVTQYADWQLAHLRVLRYMQEAVQELAADTAQTAGGMGASYGQLGVAWGISRQAARKKWPQTGAAGESLPETIFIERYGGSAEVSRVPGRSSWTWMGRGCDGTDQQAAQSCDSRWAALTAADAFLREHFVALGWRDGVDVPLALVVPDRETCWCAGIDD
ncbi:hypothetical protein GCM10010269_82090 [Streptomyces humidus]|uniref:Uncharacterized protein n=1 Tax=Streptomyces humidus TaxID=52259 RepID=A0A918GDY4_9ACTN|nr:hypothetical protein GCM10010269_82090 [Streptomyces humidus]